MSYNAGKIRNVPVTIGGCAYIPPLPFEDQVREDIRNIVESNKTPLSKAKEAIIFRW